MRDDVRFPLLMRFTSEVMNEDIIIGLLQVLIDDERLRQASYSSKSFVSRPRVDNTMPIGELA